MKSKMFIYVSIIFSLCFVFFNEIKAQGGSIRFNKSGVTIAIKTEVTTTGSTISMLDNFRELSISSSENTIHRLLTNHKNKIYFGYDLEIVPQAEKGKFKVSIKPLSINPSTLLGNELENFDNLIAQVLPKYPDDILLEDGDTITLEILENLQTKTKILDRIKIITKNITDGNYFLKGQIARDFTINDVELRLTNFEVFVNGVKSGTGGGMSGANIYYYFRDKGRFIMSPFPRQGFDLQKIGVIEGNKISFTFNGDNYKFVSTSPILGTGGKWNLWVLHDPNYRSTFAPDSPSEFGAADDIKFLFKK